MIVDNTIIQADCTKAMTGLAAASAVVRRLTLMQTD
jgi:hypothetical protein